jgi:hypothetical protein
MTTPPSTRQEVTQLLGEWSGGDEGALEKLIPLVQPELHRLAHYYMSREGEGHTLQTTALVNEAYLQFVDKTHPRWQNRPHFFAVASQRFCESMRRFSLLPKLAMPRGVDRTVGKRGEPRVPVPVTFRSSFCDVQAGH